MNLQIIFLINKLIVWVYETLDPCVTLTTDKFRNETLLFKRKVDNLHIWDPLIQFQLCLYNLCGSLIHSDASYSLNSLYEILICSVTCNESCLYVLNVVYSAHL